MADSTDPQGAGEVAAKGPELQYRMQGFEFRVRCEVDGLAPLVDRFLHPFRCELDPGRRVPTYCFSRAAKSPAAVGLSLDGVEKVGAESAEGAVDQLLWEVGHAGIATADEFLALHAGAVSWRGLGLALPAPSGFGKSTLVAGLTIAGCDYLTDEAALLKLSTGWLHPFPRALWLSQASIDLVPGLRTRVPAEPDAHGRIERHVSPDDLRPGAVGKRCSLRWVIAPQHIQGASTSLEPMRRSEAVLALIGNSFNFARFGGTGLRALGRIARDLDAYRLRFGDLEQAVTEIMRLLA